MEIIDNLVNTAINLMTQYGILPGIFLILLESIIPALPLSVFITLNIASYGNFLGFTISWLTTIVGCLLSFFLFRSTLRNKLYRFIEKKNQEQLSKLMIAFSDISFSNLTILIANPFTPAFLVNIAAGLSKMNYKKFLGSIIIGKLIMVYFWGYIGTSLLSSITDIKIIIQLVILLSISYLLSKIVNKKLKL